MPTMAWTWIILSLVLLASILQWKSKTKKKKLPLGPRQFPIFGNLLMLGEFPHQDLHQLAQKHGPTMHLRKAWSIGGKDISYLILSGKYIAIALVDQHKLSRPWSENFSVSGFFASNSCYTSHYVVICGYDTNADEFEIIDPASSSPNIGGFVYTDDYQQSLAAEGNRFKRRGTAKLAEISALDGSWKIPLPLNDQGQPIGPDGKTFVRWLGTFFHNGWLCPLVPAAWPKVPAKFKLDCWTEIKKRYLIDPDIVQPADQMGWAMHILGVLRRNRRTKLKKGHVKPRVTKEQLLANIPARVVDDQWREMVNYWFHEKTVVLLLYSSASRGTQKDIATFGAQSFAQISDNMVEANGTAVERADVYIKVYRRRDGTSVTPRAQENIVSTIRIEF
ncbi:hypothetical protein SO802_026122 [Lithocarpus litseifolius]|uniref:Cytochrome P450 n=1 Tax=Lithocarpus litseifolius TaxID=425828 RepID=A0AAW2BZ63_9ROSI